MSIEIPLLIREKLDYYRYYAHVRKQMHQVIKEYYKKICAREDDKLILCHKTSKLYRYKFYNDRNLTIPIGDKSIYALKYGPREYRLPKRYFYSSGLNNPNGYF